jgi:hypothetical protein
VLFTDIDDISLALVQAWAVTTTLRFASVVGGVGGLVLLAVIILSANDWLSSPPGDNHRIAVHVSAPPPARPVPLAATTNAPAARPMVSRAGTGERQTGQHADDHGDRAGGRGEGDGEGR